MLFRLRAKVPREGPSGISKSKGRKAIGKGGMLFQFRYKASGRTRSHVISTKPTLVFVPGAWHKPTTWNKVIEPLEKEGYKCVSVTLASTKGNPDVSFWDDLKSVRDPIEAETTQGHDVVLVVHSYGGAVGNSAIKGLARPKAGEVNAPSAHGQGHVIGLALMASGFGPSGMGFFDATGGKPPPPMKEDKEKGNLILDTDPRQFFYHDLPEDEGNYWVSQLTTQAIKPLAEPGTHSYAGWKDVPCWYLMTTEDKALPVEVQKMMVQYAIGEGRDLHVSQVTSSHSPMLSKPKEVVDFLEEAIAYFTKEQPVSGMVGRFV